jgi:hypothetical protein
VHDSNCVTPPQALADDFAAERQALERVLQSPLFQRAPSLSRILAYICDQYFKCAADKLKEYNIAVEALGRPPSFDPQADAIVRVDLHSLRKRLKAYYADSGRHEEWHIVLRAGSYAPEFVSLRNEQSRSWSGESVAETADSNVAAALALADTKSPPEALPALTPQIQNSARTEVPRLALMMRTVWLAPAICAVLGVVAGVLIAAGWFGARRPGLLLMHELPRPAKAVAAVFLQTLNLGSQPDSLLEGIRIHCGSSNDYVDSAGLIWQHDAYFTGGTAFARPMDAIARTADPSLYVSGRQGVFQYDIPVPHGVYEVHLLFAETQPGIEDGMRQVSYTVGLGQADTIDIVSDAGGVRAATEHVYANVSPGADGTIHLKFWSSESSLNAIEILPQRDGKPGPVRISTLTTLYQDPSGGHWLPDRFFRGGRNDAHEFARNRPDPPLFSRERYGSFDYSIPVAKGFKYQVTLYMAERYWGVQNSGLGGPGSRLFSVRCNGLILLSDFDLAAAQKDNRAVAVQFRDLEPDGSGKLNLSFVPVVNYPVINAIEVNAE